MTFAEYFLEIRSAVFPEGAPRNLRTSHRNAVQDAMSDIQRLVRCYQDNNCTRIRQSGWRFYCSGGAVDDEFGEITEVSTILASSACDKVVYDLVGSNDYFDALIDYAECACSEGEEGMKVNALTKVALAGGVAAPCSIAAYPTTSSNNNKGCRSGSGIWTRRNGILFIYPSIESNEIAIIRWKGVRASWADDDEIPPSFESRQARRAVEMYVEADTARRETESSTTYKTANLEYLGAIQVLAELCRRKKMKRFDPLGES